MSALAGEVTPDRYTTVELVTQEAETLARPPYYHRRRASEISRADAEVYGVSSNVRQVPGDAWILKPLYGDVSRVHTGDDAAAVVNANDVQLASGMIAQQMLREFSDLPGIGAAAGLVAAGGTAFLKTVAAGASYAAELTADVAAFAKPVLDTLHYAVDRVLAGLVTYPRRAPWGLVVPVPADFWGVDNLLGFYFGGPTDTDPPTEHGGEFCLYLRGDGQGVLYEHHNVVWKERYRFQVGAPGRANSGLFVLQIVPYGRDRIAFFTGAADGVADLPYGGFATGKPGRSTSLYRDNRSTSGHTHQQDITGAGTIRLDIRRDYQLPIGIARALYPTGGTLVDQPLFIPYPVIAGMTLALQVQAETPTGTTLTATVYNADDKQPLATDEAGEWELVAGQQHYYVVFDFTSTDREQTPVLEAYSISVAGAQETGEETVVTVEPDHEAGVSITGSGIDPSTGSAQFGLRDLYDTTGVLVQRARIKTRIKTRYSSADPSLYSILFEGETMAEGVDALLRVPDGGYAYYQYTVPLESEFARIGDQFSINLETFFEDETAAVDPLTGRLPPWKITSIIRYLFNKAGVPDARLDIPDLDLRLWTGAGYEPEDFLLQPQTKFAQALLKYARDYLDMFVVYDPNAGGKWRLLYKPLPPYTPLHTFTLDSPGAGKLPHHAGAYAANTSMILANTYRLRPVAPEANYILVVGRGGVLSDNAGSKAIVQSMWNPDSFNLNPASPTATDPTHMDYIGHMVPLLYVDPTLLTQEAVDYMCRRIYDKVAHGERRIHFRGPLALVTDAGDAEQERPRPLRVADAITVPVNKAGTAGTAILTSSPSIDFNGSDAQWADYECTVAPDA